MSFQIRHLFFPTWIWILSQFSSVQSLSRVRLFATPWIAARQASLSIANSQNSLRLMTIESVMLSSHLILCRPLLLLPPIPPSIRVFSNESQLAFLLEERGYKKKGTGLLSYDLLRLLQTLFCTLGHPLTHHGKDAQNGWESQSGLRHFDFDNPEWIIWL